MNSSKTTKPVEPTNFKTMKTATFADVQKELVSSSKNYLKQATKSVGLVNRDELLKRFGFKNDEERTYYYHLKYPRFHFITKDDFNRICEKYNLIIGKIDQYKGSIPDKNLRDIELMDTIDKKDLKHQVVFKLEDELILDLYYRIQSLFMDKDEVFNKFIKSNYRYSYNEGSRLVVCLEIPSIFKNRQDEIELSVLNSPEVKKHIDSKLLIAAPKELMKVSKGYKLKGRFIVKDDPIVAKPVKGGYMITAWGPEAISENINPNDN